MEIGTVTKKYTNIPKVIPVEIPKKIPTTPGNPKPEEKPIKVDNWPVKVPEPVEK